ncbi:MAG: competence/damage-inducible protein A [Elainellaceae cyanobacterium]
MSGSAEIICVGTELLLGDILNSNAQFIAQQLADLGIPHYYQTVVGDNASRLQKVLALACERSHLIIFTGGLGPTPDDLTTEAIASFFDTPLIERSDVIEDIVTKYAHRDKAMSPSNRKQALLPEGADVLYNPIGSAPGMIWQPRPGLTLLTFPGVPREMQCMWHEIAVPYLKRQGWGQSIIYSRMLRYWGIPESTLAEKVAPFFDLENPTVAPYAGKGEVRLRISAKADSQDAAEKLIQPVEAELRALTAPDWFGADEETLASVLGDILKSAGETVSVAESCTGGGLGNLLTTVPGSSDYFLGGVISYDNTVKENILGVDSTILAEHGAVSEAVAQQMAEGVRNALGTTWGISVTGIAGPGGGTDTKPVGLVYFGIAGPEGTQCYRRTFAVYRGRDWIRWLSTCTAADLLRRHLLDRQN